MRDFDRRLKTIEKKLMPHRRVRLLAPIISGCCGRTPTPEDEKKLGPIQTWITYQQQLQAQEKANAEFAEKNPDCRLLGAPIMIDVDVDEEYKARRGAQANERYSQTAQEGRR